MLKLEAFTDDYFPEVVVDREKEKLALKDYLLKVLEGRKNAFYIYGIPGIGKTTITKYVLNQFEDANENSEILYVNCEISTPNLVMKEIHDIICGETSAKLPSNYYLRRILNRKIKEKDLL